eukprot:TRINITY_DN137_c9_g1_i1.p1 TRINITY_DN137_c9_g1~~TRINITY_DN137_c9_g1_i1.p1  ORF type:complete len:1014 (-),score=293.41 TRINITY_DN137_c9_g1_i1:157-3198(-)
MSFNLFEAYRGQFQPGNVAPIRILFEGGNSYTMNLDIGITANEILRSMLSGGILADESMVVLIAVLEWRGIVSTGHKRSKKTKVAIRRRRGKVLRHESLLDLLKYFHPKTNDDMNMELRLCCISSDDRRIVLQNPIADFETAFPEVDKRLVTNAGVLLKRSRNHSVFWKHTQCALLQDQLLFVTGDGNNVHVVNLADCSIQSGDALVTVGVAWCIEIQTPMGEKYLFHALNGNSFKNWVKAFTDAIQVATEARNFANFDCAILDKTIKESETEVARIKAASESLEGLVADKRGKSLLYSFMKQEHSEDNLLFYLEVQRFRQKFPHMSLVERWVQVLKIFMLFIVEGSPHEICGQDKDRLELMDHFIQCPPIMQWLENTAPALINFGDENYDFNEPTNNFDNDNGFNSEEINNENQNNALIDENNNSKSSEINSIEDTKEIILREESNESILETGFTFGNIGDGNNNMTNGNMTTATTTNNHNNNNTNNTKKKSFDDGKDVFRLTIDATDEFNEDDPFSMGATTNSKDPEEAQTPFELAALQMVQTEVLGSMPRKNGSPQIDASTMISPSSSFQSSFLENASESILRNRPSSRSSSPGLFSELQDSGFNAASQSLTKEVSSQDEMAYINDLFVCSSPSRRQSDDDFAIPFKALKHNNNIPIPPVITTTVSSTSDIDDVVSSPKIRRKNKRRSFFRSEPSSPRRSISNKSKKESLGFSLEKQNSGKSVSSPLEPLPSDGLQPLKLLSHGVLPETPTNRSPFATILNNHSPSAPITPPTYTFSKNQRSSSISSSSSSITSPSYGSSLSSSSRPHIPIISPIFSKSISLHGEQNHKRSSRLSLGHFPREFAGMDINQKGRTRDARMSFAGFHNNINLQGTLSSATSSTASRTSFRTISPRGSRLSSNWDERLSFARFSTTSALSDYHAPSDEQLLTLGVSLTPSLEVLQDSLQNINLDVSPPFSVFDGVSDRVLGTLKLDHYRRLLEQPKYHFWLSKLTTTTPFDVIMKERDPFLEW